MKKRKNVLIKSAVAIMMVTSMLAVSSCGKAEKTDESVSETTKSDSEKIMVDKYGFNKDELNGFDTDKFVKDYHFDHGGYTPYAVREVYNNAKDQYMIDETKEGTSAEEPSVEEAQTLPDRTTPATGESSASTVNQTEDGYIINSSEVGNDGVSVGEGGLIAAGDYSLTTKGHGVFGILKAGENYSDMKTIFVGDDESIGESQIFDKYCELDEGDTIFISSTNPDGLTIELTKISSEATEEADVTTAVQNQ